MRFFQMYRKYAVRRAGTGEKGRRFIEETTGGTYEQEQAIKLGFPLFKVCSAVASYFSSDPHRDPHAEKSGWS